jgi:prepilin signal peptidase PulO-like enzyme (type II secretory pathway)
LTNLLLGLGAALLGLAAGVVTHRANQAFIPMEEDATEPPLPREALWAPLLDGALLALLFYRYGLSLYSVVAGVIVLLLVQVLVFDARHRLILNRVMYPAIVVALLLAPVNPLLHGTGMTWQGRVLAGVAGAVVAGGFFYLLSVVTSGGVGMGDAKLSFFLGAVFGGLPLPVPGVLRVLVFGMLAGGVIAGLLLVTRIRGMRDFIPYGPFLCLGALIHLMYPCGFAGPLYC